MANITHPVCTVDDCFAPHFGRGFCNKHYYRNVRRPKKTQRFAECQWCGLKKPLSDMRQPNVSRGKTPSTCYQCRQENPNLHWCDFHKEPHEKARFTPRPGSAIGFVNVCVTSQARRASTARGLPPNLCVSCKQTRASWEFSGGRQKSPTCIECVAANHGKRWCLDCKDWIHTDMFSRTGRGNRFMTVRCNPCRAAHAHGTTVNAVLAKQGVLFPQCGACGSIDMLHIDHDHAHCPGPTGCEQCVRGYLCHQCNTSEGLLESSARARKLADYMERHGL